MAGLSDITLNSKTYSLSTVNGSTVLRQATAGSIPEGIDSATVEISHAVGLGNKPDRHLARFTNTVIDEVSKKEVSFVAHVVLIVPKGTSRELRESMFSGDNSLIDDISTLLSTDTFSIGKRLINGEFS